MLSLSPTTLIVLATAGSFTGSSDEVGFGSAIWWAYAGLSVFLVIFAGIMSGLTLGLMSLGLVDLEVLERSGTEKQKKQAATILPVVQKQHQLLVTLLLCNAAAMEILQSSLAWGRLKSDAKAQLQIYISCNWPQIFH